MNTERPQPAASASRMATRSLVNPRSSSSFEPDASRPFARTRLTRSDANRPNRVPSRCKLTQDSVSISSYLVQYRDIYPIIFYHEEGHWTYLPSERAILTHSKHGKEGTQPMSNRSPPVHQPSALVDESYFEHFACLQGKFFKPSCCRRLLRPCLMQVLPFNALRNCQAV